MVDINLFRVQDGPEIETQSPGTVIHVTYMYSFKCNPSPVVLLYNQLMDSSILLSLCVCVFLSKKNDKYKYTFSIHVHLYNDDMYIFLSESKITIFILDGHTDTRLLLYISNN